MKCAVFIGGLPRSFAATAPWVKYMTSECNNVDVFTYAWRQFEYEGDNEESFRAAYEPKICEFADYSAHQPGIVACAKRLPPIKIKNRRLSPETGLIAQYYSVYKAFKLIPNPDDYDVIVRMRFDIQPVFKLDLDKIKVVDRNVVCCPKQRNKGLRGSQFMLDDVMIAGSPDSMRKYVDLFNVLWSGHMYKDAMLEHNCAIPEFILAYHLHQCGVDVQKCDFDYLFMLPRFMSKAQRSRLKPKVKGATK